MFGRLLSRTTVIRALAECEDLTRDFSTVSLDLFDTLIYRSALSRREIQELVAEHAVGMLSRFDIAVISTNSFITLRSNVTKKLKFGYWGQLNFEPKLEEVISRVFKELKVPDDLVESLMLELLEVELSLEMSSLRIMDGVIDLLNFLRKQRKQIVIITDMYLSREYIERILLSLGLEKYFDEILVSSEFGATKRDGSLYGIARNMGTVRFNNAIHIGDNYKSDVKNAVDHGISAVYFKRRPNKVFQAHDHNIVPIDHQLGDLVVSFLARVAFKCRAIGIKRLYFLSRDATVLGRLMLHAIEHSEYLGEIMAGIEVRDLFLNRYTTLYLDVDFEQEPIAQILSKSIKLFPKGYTIIELSERLGIQYDDIDTVDVTVEPKLDFYILAEQIQLRSGSFCGRLIQAVQDHNKIVSEYLFQESVLGTADPVALVDLGYEGSIVKAISRYSKLRSNAIPFDVYLILFCTSSDSIKPVGPNKESPEFGTIAIDQRRLSSLMRLNYSWLEIFFQDSSIGPLTGYIRSNGEVVPHFTCSAIHFEPNRWEYFCREKLETDMNLGLFMTKAYLDVSAKRFLVSMSRPTRATLTRLADRHYVGGLLDEVRSTIIRDNLNLERVISLRSFRNLVANDVWIIGSLYASGLKWAYPLLQVVVSCYFFLKKWYNSFLCCFTR